MRIVDLPSWSDFHDAIADIREEFSCHTVELPDGHQDDRKNDILFRGQSNSEWELKTTLERTTDTNYSVLDYVKRADLVVNEIESVTGTKWELPTIPEIRKEITKAYDPLRAHIPCYEYLAYLRHHEFPSPLLDWSRSPQIAAYFALEQSSKAERCSVYAFIEMPEGGKSLRGGDVMISTMGPYITTHARHFAQKASYTIATQCDRAAKRHSFRSHQDVTPCPTNDQDVLVKITIPRVDRVSALQQLDDYNINHYTLFNTDDSLVRSLALRVFVMGET